MDFFCAWPENISKSCNYFVGKTYRLGLVLLHQIKRQEQRKMTQTFNLSQIMKQAWTIRKEYAVKINCPVSEVLMGECLRMAWSQAKRGNMNQEAFLSLIKQAIATEK